MRKTIGALGLLFALVLGLLVQGDVRAATLAGSVKIIASIDYQSAIDLTTGTAKLAKTYTLALATGTGAGQADLMFTDTRTIAASTTEDLDVSGGSLADVFGTTYTIAELKLLIVCAASGNTNNVVLGGDANSVPFFDAAADSISLKPGGCFMLSDPTAGGVAVTAATGDIIQVANSGAGTTVDYDIIIAGSSS